MVCYGMYWHALVCAGMRLLFAGHAPVCAGMHRCAVKRAKLALKGPKRCPNGLKGPQNGARWN